MDRSNSNTSTANSRTKPGKKRNSDVRKEQNRIASRAYREKRKQKLALLDEILKTDSQTDSMSSVSDETEGYTASWSLAQSRHASNSPVPAALATVPMTTQWPTSPPLPSAVPEYSHDSYETWMNCYDRSNNAFSTSNDYVQQFVSAEVAGNSLDTATSYNMSSIPSMTSAPSTPPVPQMPLDPLLVANFTSHSHHVQPAHITSSSGLSIYNNEDLQGQIWIDSLEDNTVAALERFSQLSCVQQKQALVLIQERRHLPRTTSHEEFIYPTCQATPPPSAQFLSTDFRKYQNMRHASRSPIPSGHH